ASMPAPNPAATLSHATARPAQLLQPSRQIGELRIIEGQCADHPYTLAAAAANFPTDAHARRLRGGARGAAMRRAPERPGLRRVPQHQPWCGLPALHA